MSATAAQENSRLRALHGRAGRVRRRQCMVVGIGNPFMGDDGFGIEVAKVLRKLNLGRGVIILERQTVDISILDTAKVASKLVIVDAVKSGRPPGSIVKLVAGGPRSPSLRVPLSHEQDLHDIFVLARKSGIRLPPTVVIGVEPADCSIGKGLSAEIRRALPRTLKEVRGEVKECVEGGRMVRLGSLDVQP